MAICAVLQRGVFDLGTCLPYWFWSLLRNYKCSLPESSSLWPVQLTHRITWSPAWMPEQNYSGFSPEQRWSGTGASLYAQGTLEPSTVVYTHKCVQGEFGQGEAAGVCNSELSSPLQETAAGPGQVPVLGHVSWHEMWQLSWEQAESKAAAAAGKGLPALGFQEGQGKSICCVL